LLDQMEAREEELGRTLTQDDVAAILKAHGKPELVALRYLPQRSLIGPTVFPFYVYTLRKALPLVVLVYAVAEGASMLDHSPTKDGLAAGIVSAVFGLLPTLIYFVGVVTVVFAVIEATKSGDKVKAKLGQWDPLKMEKVKPESLGKQKPLWSRVIDVALHSLWLAYLLVLPRHMFWVLGPGTFYLDSMGVAFAPVWHTFYVILVAVVAIQLLVKMIALRPGTNAWTKPAKLVLDLAGIVALTIVASSHEIFVAAGPRADFAQIAHVNHAVLLAMRFVLLFAVIGFAKDAWKLVQKKVPMGQLAF